ncbi:hypothetical protein QVD17_41507 [Tagetes erecta]|uniref:Uncharacterized protein n=1 Tax=Tagetes erecta TaxID=13708 RepID=A0AAD8NFP2_TARER|nr:hypothetical protein QVD17_41507 [Tagetes erecta]
MQHVKKLSASLSPRCLDRSKLKVYLVSNYVGDIRTGDSWGFAFGQNGRAVDVVAVFISLRIFEAAVLTPVIEQRAVFEAEGQIRYEYVLFVSNCRDLKGVLVCDDNGVTWDPNVYVTKEIKAICNWAYKVAANGYVIEVVEDVAKSIGFSMEKKMMLMIICIQQQLTQTGSYMLKVSPPPHTGSYIFFPTSSSQSPTSTRLTNPKSRLMMPTSSSSSSPSSSSSALPPSSANWYVENKRDCFDLGFYIMVSVFLLKVLPGFMFRFKSASLLYLSSNSFKDVIKMDMLIEMEADQKFHSL